MAVNREFADFERTLSREPLANLVGHPENESLYGKPHVPKDFVQSIRKGIINPILVCRNPSGGFRILAGHRRFAAAVECELEYVPVAKLKGQIDGDQQVEILIHSNKNREKSPATMRREAKKLDEIERARAKERRGTRTDLTSGSSAPQVKQSSAKSIASAVGTSEANVKRWRQADLIKDDIKKEAQASGYDPKEIRKLTKAVDVAADMAPVTGLRVAKQIKASVAAGAKPAGMTVDSIVQSGGKLAGYVDECASAKLREQVKAMPSNVRACFVRVVKAVESSECDPDLMRAVRAYMKLKPGDDEHNKFRAWFKRNC